MLRLNVNQEKQLTFEVQIGGVHHDQITSQFKIILGEVEYGFPARVGRDTITVDLPPLNKIVGSKISEGDEAEVRLEIIADGHFLTPWQDRATLSNPLVVEAKIKDGAFVPNPALETRLVVEEDGAKQTAIVQEKKPESITEGAVERLTSKLEKLIEMQEQSNLPPSPEKEDEEADEEVEEKCEKPTKEEKEIKPAATTEPVEEDIKDKAQALERLLNKTIDTFQLGEDKKDVKGMTLEEFKRNLTKEDILKYIEKKGTKNAEIQELIYEQAKIAASKDTPPHILKEVVKIMRKK